MKKEVLLQLIKKPTRRIRILGLSGILIIAVSIFAYYVGVVSPSLARAFTGSGDGSTDYPFAITNCSQLQEMNLTKWANYVLVSDIDCSETSSWNNGAGFEPISNFQGSFDGRGYIIRDLYINRPQDLNPVGLFSYIANGGVRLADVRLDKNSVNADRVDITGGGDVGALVGEFQGYIIENVHSKLTVQTTATWNNGDGPYGRAGGLVGSLKSVIDHSSASGKVTALGTGPTGRNITIGGLVGFMNDYDVQNKLVAIHDSYTGGTVGFAGDASSVSQAACAGLVGSVQAINANNQYQIRTSYSIADVSCLNTASEVSAAGLIGSIYESQDVTEHIMLADNFAAGEVRAANMERARGLYTSYAKNGNSQLPGYIDFGSNAFDQSATQVTNITPENQCGENFGLGESITQCQVVNSDNSEPDFFTSANQTGFFDDWDASIDWLLGDSYPTMLAWPSRTNAPTNIAVQRDGGDFIVSWVKPSGDGSRTEQITDYLVYYRDKSQGNSADWTVREPGDADTVTISGLSIPGKYEFKVRARYHSRLQPGAFDPGLSSDIFEFATGMPETAPENIQVNPEPKGAAISWDALESATSYGAEYRQTGTQEWQALYTKYATSIPPDEENESRFGASMAELNPQTSYQVRLRGANVAGPGPWSEPVAFTTPAQQLYNVSTCQQLQDINDDPMGVYTMTADIDCSNFDFQPIGFQQQANDTTPFMGTFNGNGFKINNLSIIAELQTGPSQDFRAVGLFAFTYRAVVTNVTIANSAVVANYALDEAVDSDQNGLPDGPDLDFSQVDLPDRVPTNLNELNYGAGGAFVSARDVLASISPNFVTDTYGNMAKVATGGVIGFAIGEGQYSNIRTVNTAIRGGLAGGVIGMLLPVRSTAEIIDIGNAKVGEPMVVDGLHSDGLIIGHLSGGVIGLAVSSIGNAFGQPIPLTIQNSTSSSEVQGSVSGGLIGLALNTSIANGFIRGVAAGQSGAGDLEQRRIISQAVQYMGSTQTVIIRNSQSSGLVSACESLSGLRIAALGGIVGIGIGVQVDSTVSNSPIRNCSATPSNWGVYGGFTGGIGGLLLVSRITNSSNTGSITAVNNDPPEQSTAINMYGGVNGGLAGIMVNIADDRDGNFMINNSFSTGSISVDSKQGFVGVSGGVVGITLGSGTIQNTYSTGNINHHLTNKFVGGASFAGGLTGLSIGMDVPYSLATYLERDWDNDPQAVLGESTHGLVINNSYATGNVKVQKDRGGGNLAIGGGLSGLMIGQADIKNSYATGSVTGGLPDKIGAEGDIANPLEIFSQYNFKVGAAVSGGLVGATLGVDIPKFVGLLLTGLTSNPFPDATTSGIVINNTHATGNVKGNLAGGLVGSADMKTAINKSYAEGNVDGAIVGGLVGQVGFAQDAITAGGGTAFGLGVLGSTDASTASEKQKQGVIAAAVLFDKAQLAIGPVQITNTYATGNVTSIPGLADPQINFRGEARPIDPVRLPSTAGGLIGLNMSAGARISDSYAAGDVTVKADQPVEDRTSTSNGLVVSVGKIPSVAGGLIGINIATPQPSMEKIARDVFDDVDSGQFTSAYFTNNPQTITNSFSASKMTLNSETLTGGTVGVFISPLHFVNAFLLGKSTSDADVAKMYNVSNVYLDKSRVSVANCNGPNKRIYDVAKNFVLDSTVKDTTGKDWPVVQISENGDMQPLKTALRDHESQILEAKFDFGQSDHPETLPTVAQVFGQVDQLLGTQTACDYVNDNNSQPNYFIANKTNSPMDSWNFGNVWVVRKGDYPKFVAGVETEVPTDDGTPTGPTKPTDGGSTTTTAPITPENSPEILRNATRNIAKKLNISGGPEQVKGLKAILASVPVFIARSVPYSLILLILMLAALYSWQALRQYRELSVYHRSISRIANTKEAIDDYLAITTHYLNTPVAIMGGAIELLTSLKKINAAKAESLQTKIKRFADAAAALLIANQVSNAQTSGEERLVEPKQSSPFKAKAVWVPAVVALSLLALANALFIYADVFNKSPFRIFVELSLYALGVGLVGLAYRYRNSLEETKEITKKQLALEAELYKKRGTFIPEALKVIKEHFETLEIASESLKKLPEAKLFFNGLNMLGGINKGLTNIEKFSKFTDQAPLFDVTTYAQKAVAQLNTENSDKKITFDARINPGIVMRIQADEMRQIIDSVLGNAAKFSKVGGNVEVLLFKRLNKLVLSVSDTGVGISEQKLPSLLKPFTRGTESMQYNYEGIGLGLYTTKVITDKLGGTISIRSKLGAGTTVTITLPAEREPNILLAMPIIAPTTTS